MDESRPDPASSADAPLQFDRALPEPGSAEIPSLVCGGCGQAIADRYWRAADKSLCSACAQQIAATSAAAPEGSALLRFLRAAMFGAAGAALGAGLYFLIAKLTGYEIGLVAIVVGVLVGAAVRAGAGGEGGRRYQLLAVALTYLSIVSTYIPAIWEGMTQRADAGQARQAPPVPPEGTAAETVAPDGATTPPESEPKVEAAEALPATVVPAAPPSVARSLAVLVAGAVFLIGFACIAPFLGGLQNLMGLVIIAIGLWEAWRSTARRKVAVTGPFPLESAPGSGA